jgi:hypothetical protein
MLEPQCWSGIDPRSQIQKLPHSESKSVTRQSFGISGFSFSTLQIKGLVWWIRTNVHMWHENSSSLLGPFTPPLSSISEHVQGVQDLGAWDVHPNPKSTQSPNDLQYQKQILDPVQQRFQAASRAGIQGWRWSLEGSKTLGLARKSRTPFPLLQPPSSNLLFPGGLFLLWSTESVSNFWARCGVPSIRTYFRLLYPLLKDFQGFL